MKKNTYSLFLFVIGLYIIIDGLGSILIYRTQPLFFDHFMRIIRAVLGVIIAYIGFNLYTKKEGKTYNRKVFLSLKKY